MAANENTYEHHDKLWKWGMYLLSMALFAVIVIILTCPYEIHIGHEWCFVGWRAIQAWLCGFPLIFIALLVVDLGFYVYFRRINLTGSERNPITIEKIESLQSDIMSFLASYFIPLVSFDIVNKSTHRLVLLILFIVIGMIYVKGNLYYQNPTLSLIGFKAYRIRFKFNDETCKESEERKVVTFSELSENDKITYIPLSGKVWFAIKKTNKRLQR